jgi:Rrf2 family protein
MFSTTAEYALRAVVYLAMNPKTRSNSQTISENTKAPAGYVSKVLNDLVRADIVTSQRGPNGGFGLARPASRITVLEVINAVDPIERIRTCPLNIPSHGANLCRLHRKLDDAIAMIEKTLSGSTIEEMCEPARAGGQLIYPTLHAPSKSKRESRAR